MPTKGSFGPVRTLADPGGHGYDDEFYVTHTKADPCRRVDAERSIGLEVFEAESAVDLKTDFSQ